MAFLGLIFQQLPNRIAISIKNYINQLGRKPKSQNPLGDVDISGLIESIGGQEVITQILKGVIGRFTNQESGTNPFEVS